jgi:hypothetical protein
MGVIGVDWPRGSGQKELTTMGFRAAAPIACTVASLVVAVVGAPSGAASKPSGDAILAQAITASESASSLTMTGSVTQPTTHITLDVTASSNGNGFGSVGLNGQTINLIRDGATVYFKASASFWTKNANAQAAALLGGKWVSTAATSSEGKTFSQFFNSHVLMQQFFGNKKAMGVTTSGTTEFDGHRVAVVVVRRGGSTATADIASGSPHYLYRAILSDGSKHGTITIEHYDQPVHPRAPAGAIDITKLTQP